MFLSQLYYKLSQPERSAKKIGLFRTLCAIFGGLLTAYLAMTLIAVLTPSSIGNSIILPLLFNTLAWSCTALWISIAPTKLSALLRFLMPSLIFSIILFILF